MKVDLILSSLFLPVSVTARNAFAFSISDGMNERDYKEAEKASAMTTTRSTKSQPSQAISFEMREDVPPLDLTGEVTSTYSTKTNYLIHPMR